MKSNVFVGSEISFEYENVVAVRDMGFKLEVYLFGGFIQPIDNATEIASFKLWYSIFLETKYCTDKVKEEEVLGL